MEVKVIASASVPVSTKKKHINISTSGNVLVSSAPPQIYEGEYQVIPSASRGQILPTESKFLDKNIEVSKIPYYETKNNAGGNTIYIADELELS